MSGLSLLGLQDFPGQGTALVGMMDAHLRPKPFAFARPGFWRGTREIYFDQPPVFVEAEPLGTRADGARGYGLTLWDAAPDSFLRVDFSGGMAELYQNED